MARFINPLGIKKYKISTYQIGINAIIQRYIVSASDRLLNLDVLLTGSSMFLRGILREPELNMKNIRLGNIHFMIKLAKEEIYDYEVHLRIRKFSVYNPGKRFSLLRIIDLCTKTFRRRILEGIAYESSPITIAVPFKTVAVNLRFLFDRIPFEVRHFGKMKILNIAFEEGRIVWYLESNVIIKSLIDFLGPDFIEVEQIDEHRDPQRLLTDFQFDAADIP